MPLTFVSVSDHSYDSVTVLLLLAYCTYNLIRVLAADIHWLANVIHYQYTDQHTW